MRERLRALVSKVRSLASAVWARGPQRAVLLLAAIVLLLVGLVGWFVVTWDDEDEDVEASGTEETPSEATTTTAAPTTVPTTTLPETTTTTLSEEAQAEQDVIEAYEAAVEIAFESMAEPIDPEDPALAEHFVGGALNERRNALESMVSNGWATRIPEDSAFDLGVETVTFEEEDGVEVAYLDVCQVTDEEMYWVANGEPVPHLSGLRTIETEVQMQKIDGQWMAADGRDTTSEEGITGCAAD